VQEAERDLPECILEKGTELLTKLDFLLNMLQVKDHRRPLAARIDRKEDHRIHLKPTMKGKSKVQSRLSVKTDLLLLGIPKCHNTIFHLTFLTTKKETELGTANTAVMFHHNIGTHIPFGIHLMGARLRARLLTSI